MTPNPHLLIPRAVPEQDHHGPAGAALAWIVAEAFACPPHQTCCYCGARNDDTFTQPMVRVGLTWGHSGCAADEAHDDKPGEYDEPWCAEADAPLGDEPW